MVANPSTTACVRLDAFPDAGIFRLRLIGRVDPAARRRAGCRWFNSLPVDHAARCLAEAGISVDLVYRLLERRPLREDWRAQTVASAGSGSSAALLPLVAMLEGPAGGEGRK
jgi:allantoicase